MEEAVGCGGSDVKAFNFIVMHDYRKLYRKYSFQVDL